MNGPGFIKRDSIIHRLNPALKFIIFIITIAMIFLPLGFFAQMLVGIVILAVYWIAKLPKKTLWTILKSVMVLFALLLLINWCIYKDPIAVFIPSHHFGMMVGDINNNLNMVQLHHNNDTFISNLWGGQVGGFVSPDSKIHIGSKDYTLANIVQMNHISSHTLNEMYNSLSTNSQKELLILCHNDKTLAQNYLWVINNSYTLNIDGTKYRITTTILNNTNNGLINPYSVVYSITHWYTLSPKAIELALYVSLKVFLMIVAATILTATTTSIELTYALEDIFSPLKIFRFPVAEVSMMIAIALRFIPSLLSESQRVLNAQSSRGVDFKNGNFLDKCKAIVSLVVPLFSIAFQKAGELANAMDARSYNPRYARTRYRIFKVKWFDWIVFALLCLLFGFLIGMTAVKFDFAPFGIFELGILLG